jgi:hypothetical protein
MLKKERQEEQKKHHGKIKSTIEISCSYCQNTNIKKREGKGNGKIIDAYSVYKIILIKVIYWTYPEG